MTSVTLETNLSELLEQHPELEQVFDQNGYLLDVQCLDKSDNMLEDAAAICGFDAQEMMDALNAALQAETVAG